MRVAVVLEHRFVHTADGRTWGSGPIHYPVWGRYLEVFEEVQVVGRSRFAHEVPEGFQRVDGPGVIVAHIPYFHGPEQYLLRAAQVRLTMKRVLRRDDAVVLRSSGTLANVAFAVLGSRQQPFGVEVVIDPQEMFRQGVMHPLRPVFRLIFPRVLRKQCLGADAVQYVTRQALQRRYPARPGAPTFDVSDVLLPAEAYARAPRHYTAPAWNALLVGSLDQWYKSPDVVLRALAKLRAHNLPVHFTLVGGGRLRDEVQSMADRLGIADAVHLVGPRSSPVEVRQDLQRAELFLLPSRAEGLPRALLEAMAQGLPAVASDVGGIPELIPQRWLVQPGNPDDLARAWRELASSPQLLTEASQRNLQLSQEYSDEVLSSRRRAFLEAVRASAVLRSAGR